MPTMSSSLRSANSTSSSDLSSPPNTRCRSCLAGRLGASAARMVDLSIGPWAAATLRVTAWPPTSHLPFHLSASEAFCGKVRARSPKTAAQELADKACRRGGRRGGGEPPPPPPFPSHAPPPPLSPLFPPPLP